MSTAATWRRLVTALPLALAFSACDSGDEPAKAKDPAPAKADAEDPADAKPETNEAKAPADEGGAVADTEWGQQSRQPDLGARADPPEPPPDPIDPTLGTTSKPERPMATKYGLPPRPAKKYGMPPRPKPDPDDPLSGL